MVNAPTDALSLVTCSKRKIIQVDDFASACAQIQMQATQLYESQLNSLDLMECILDLSNTVVADDAKVFVDMMVNKAPELVFLGFLQAQVNLQMRSISEYVVLILNTSFRVPTMLGSKRISLGACLSCTSKALQVAHLSWPSSGKSIPISSSRAFSSCMEMMAHRFLVFWTLFTNSRWDSFLLSLNVSLIDIIISLVAPCYFEYPAVVLCFGPGSSSGSPRVFEFGEMVAGQGHRAQRCIHPRMFGIP